MGGEKDRDQSKEIDRLDDFELADDDLETVTGGLGHAGIKICENCRMRIAVQHMALCGECYRKKVTSL